MILDLVKGSLANRMYWFQVQYMSTRGYLQSSVCVEQYSGQVSATEELVC